MTASTSTETCPQPAYPGTATGTTEAGLPVDVVHPLLGDFDGVVRDHQRRIFRVLVGWVRDPELADTLTQETFLRAWRRRATYRGDAAVATWLTTIAVHVARDHARSKRQGFWRRLFSGRDREDDQAAAEAVATPEPSPEQRVTGKQAGDRIWRAVEQLPERQRQVFQLRHLDDLRLREIADVLGLAEGTVKVHLSRAVHSLRESLEELT